MPPQNKSSTATLCYFILFGICANFFSSLNHSMIIWIVSCILNGTNGHKYCVEGIKVKSNLH